MNATDRNPAEAPQPSADAVPLPAELDACHALIVEQARAIVEAEATVEGLKAYVAKLLEQLYGQRRERMACDPRQQTLDFGDDPAARDALAEARELRGAAVERYAAGDLALALDLLESAEALLEGDAE